MPLTDDAKEKITYETGATRDSTDDKLRVDLIPEWSLLKLSEHFQAGAQKYEARQWEKGLPLSTFIASLKRHLLLLEHGDYTEDHESAIAWNIMCYKWTKRRIEIGMLSNSLDDVSERYYRNSIMREIKHG